MAGITVNIGARARRHRRPRRSARATARDSGSRRDSRPLRPKPLAQPLSPQASLVQRRAASLIVGTSSAVSGRVPPPVLMCSKPGVARDCVFESRPGITSPARRGFLQGSWSRRHARPRRRFRKPRRPLRPEIAPSDRIRDLGDEVRVDRVGFVQLLLCGDAVPLGRRLFLSRRRLSQDRGVQLFLCFLSQLVGLFAFRRSPSTGGSNQEEKQQQRDAHSSNHREPSP